MTFDEFCQSEKGKAIREHLEQKFNGESTLHELILKVCWSWMEYDPSNDPVLVDRQEGIDSRPHRDRIVSHSRSVLAIREFMEQSPDITKQALRQAIAEHKGNTGLMEELEIHKMVGENFEDFKAILEKYAENIIPASASPPSPKGEPPVKIKGYGVPFEVAGLLFRAPAGRLDKHWARIREHALYFRLTFIFRHYSEGKLDEMRIEDQLMPSFGKPHFQNTTQIASILFNEKGIDDSTVPKAVGQMVDDQVRLVTLEFPQIKNN